MTSMQDSFQYSWKQHCVWISVISVFPLIYCGFYFSIKYTITKVSNEDQQVIPDIVRLNSSGPAGELYPDSLGDYRLTDITHNGLPVYQNSARDDRYIVANGNSSRLDNSLYLILHSNSKQLVHLTQYFQFRTERVHHHKNRRWTVWFRLGLQQISKLYHCQVRNWRVT